MKQQIAAVILAVSVVGGVGTGLVVNHLRADSGKPEDKQTASPTVTATTPAPDKTEPTSGSTGAKPPSKPAIQPVGALRIFAGSVGPVKVGMSKSQAYATGYLDKDVNVPQCDRVDQLVWRAGYKDVLDIFTLDDGEVSSIGVRAAGPRTRSGLQVGSTYKAVKDVLGEDSAPVEAGYDQTGLFVNEGDNWIGFLFDASTAMVNDSTPVTFIEVTRDALPNLMRDGC